MAQQNRDFGYREVVLKALSSSNLDFYTPNSVKFLARNLSLVFPDLEADRLVLLLQDLGFAVDSGSACRSADMVPSHVLSAMGAKVTGNIRITFHQSTTAGQVSDLANALVSAVKTLRGI
jgi:cysteine desulfurase